MRHTEVRGRPQVLRDPAQLFYRLRQTDQNQAADESRRAGDDQRIAEAEFVDGDAESDHGRAGECQNYAEYQ